MLNKFSAILLLFVVAFTCFDTTYAAKKTSKKPKIEQAKTKKSNAQKAKKQSKKDVEKKQKEVKFKINELARIKADIKERQNKVIKINDEIDAIDAKIKILNDSIELLDSRLSAMQAKYASVVKKTYLRNRNATSDIAFIFSAKSVSQAYKRIQAVKRISKWQKQKSAELKKLKSRLEAKKREMEELKESRVALLKELETELNSLQEQRDKAEEIVDSLKKEQKILEKEYKRRVQEEKEFEDELNKLIAEEQKRQREEQLRKEKLRQDSIRKAKELEEKRLKEEAKKKKEQEEAKKKKQDNKKDKAKPKEPQKPQHQEPAKPEQTAPKPQPVIVDTDTQSRQEPKITVTGNFANLKGKLPYPAEGRIVRHFGEEKLTNKLKFYNYGISISTTPGATVRAVCDGVVTAITRKGAAIIINHGEYSTVYKNMYGYKVSKGDKVKLGQAIGTLRIDPDDPEYSLLYFEIIKDNLKLNPEEWLRR